MTVSYTADVSNASPSGFLKTIFRWRGSLWKLVWHELLIWCAGYAVLSVVYRTAMNDWQKIKFEQVCNLMAKYGDFIPFSFMLGYYVTVVVSRWQTQFSSIGWIDRSIMFTSSYIRGTSERARMMRRGIARQMCLLQVLVFRSISVPVRKRFPTLDSLVAAGYIMPEEQPDLADTKYWLPIKWAMSIVQHAREEGFIQSDNAVSDIYTDLTNLRVQLLSLWLADWVPVPLNYTQVVFLSVRIYFLIMLMGRQYLAHERNASKFPVDAYVPFMSMIQVVVYIGWLKVAEALLNPFGADDDDFECNWIIDRNFKEGMRIAEMGAECTPNLDRDAQWGSSELLPMYSAETVLERQNGAVGSASEVHLPGAGMVTAEEAEEIRRKSTVIVRVSTAFRTLTGEAARTAAHPEEGRNHAIAASTPRLPGDANGGSRRGSLIPAPAPRRNSINVASLSSPHIPYAATAPHKWSIGSTTSAESEPDLATRAEAFQVPAKMFKAKRFIVRNYSDIAEGQEDEDHHDSPGKEVLAHIPEAVGVESRRRLVSEGERSEPRLALEEEAAAPRRTKSTPNLHAGCECSKPHLLFPHDDEYDI